MLCSTCSPRKPPPKSMDQRPSGGLWTGLFFLAVLVGLVCLLKADAFPSRCCTSDLDRAAERHVRPALEKPRSPGCSSRAWRPWRKGSCHRPGPQRNALRGFLFTSPNLGPPMQFYGHALILFLRNPNCNYARQDCPVRVYVQVPPVVRCLCLCLVCRPKTLRGHQQSGISGGNDPELCPRAGLLSYLRRKLHA